MVSALAPIGIAFAAVAFALAAIIVAAAPRSLPNRALAALLVLDGLGWLGIAEALLVFGVDPGGAVTWWFEFTITASPWFYAAFVAATMKVPWTRWLSRPGALWTLWALGISVALVRLLWLEGDPVYGRIRDVVGLTSGPAIVIGVWAMAVSFQYFRLAPERRRAVAFVTAFTVRNLALIALFGSAQLVKRGVLGGTMFEAILVALKAMLLLHVLYVAYGVLSGQVVDLDDRVRRGLQRVIVALAIAGVFLVLTEGTEMVVPVDSPVLALLAAGVITVLFQPLQRLAQRLAQRLFPGMVVDDTVGYRQRTQLYRQQVEVAYADGHMGKKEREMLDRLAATLRLDEADVQRLEKDAAPA